MAADFGLGGYSEAELAEMFGLLRGLRLTARDFLPEPSPEARPGPRPDADAG